MAGEKKVLDFQLQQTVAEGHCHPVNLPSPVLLCAGNFHFWTIQRKMFVLFSVDLFQHCNWCHQPAKKDIKSVSGSKTVLWCSYDLLGNPMVTCWGSGGLLGFLHCVDLATLLVMTGTNSEAFRCSWHDWTGWHSFLEPMWDEDKFAVTRLWVIQFRVLSCGMFQDFDFL